MKPTRYGYYVLEYKPEYYDELYVKELNEIIGNENLYVWKWKRDIDRSTNLTTGSMLWEKRL